MGVACAALGRYEEAVPSATSTPGIANAYRIVGLISYNRMGTRGRGMDSLS
jgi:hypothetical protein